MCKRYDSYPFCYCIKARQAIVYYFKTWWRVCHKVKIQWKRYFSQITYPWTNYLSWFTDMAVTRNVQTNCDKCYIVTRECCLSVKTRTSALLQNLLSRYIWLIKVILLLRIDTFLGTCTFTNYLYISNIDINKLTS